MEEAQRSYSKAGGVLLAFGLTVLAILAAEILTLPAIIADPALFQDPGAASRWSITSLMVLNFMGFFLVGAAYLWLTDRGWSFVDLSRPSLVDVAYVVGGTIATLGVLILAGIVAEVIGIEPTESQVVEFVEGDPTMVLIMIAIVFLFNAPAEEFLFRNVIQKRLYLAFSRVGAIGVTSVIFALIHAPVFALDETGALASADAVFLSLTIIFLGSIVFGYIYAKTDNILVPIAAHALYNAVQFGLLYLELVLDDVPAVLTVVAV